MISFPTPVKVLKVSSELAPAEDDGRAEVHVAPGTRIRRVMVMFKVMFLEFNKER